MPREFYKSPNFCPEQPYRTAAMHIHTSAGLGGSESYKDLLAIVLKLNTVDTVVITDYNCVGTSKDARAHVQRNGYPIEVITGSEITTKEGSHVLALGIEDDIPPGLSIKTTNALIHKQRGLAIAAHPFFGKIAGGGAFGEKRMRYFANVSYEEDRLDGVEIFNGGVAARNLNTNKLALEFYIKHADQTGAAVGGSDTHNWGPAFVQTAFQGENLLEAIRQKKTAVLYLDRQERQHHLNIALDILGERVFQDIPFSIQRIMGRHIPSIQIFAAQLDQMARLNARQAFKRAYCAFSNQDPEAMESLSVRNKIFGNHRSGPPYIEGGIDAYFSLAHSGDMGIGAVADVPIGVDVEKVNCFRPPRIGLLSEEEIAGEKELSPDLDSHEIGCKLSTIKEAVGKGLLRGNSRHSSFGLIPLDAESYIVEPFRNGVPLPLWQAKVFRRGDYFLTVAIGTLTKTDLQLNWISE